MLFWRERCQGVKKRTQEPRCAVRQAVSRPKKGPSHEVVSLHKAGIIISGACRSCSWWWSMTPCVASLPLALRCLPRLPSQPLPAPARPRRHVRARLLMLTRPRVRTHTRVWWDWGRERTKKTTWNLKEGLQPLWVDPAGAGAPLPAPQSPPGGLESLLSWLSTGLW